MEHLDWLALKPLWLVIAALAGVVELLTMSGFFLGFAFAALAIYGLLWLWPALPPVAIAGLFALLSVAFSFAYLRAFRRFNRRSDAPLLNDRLARNIGRIGVAADAFENGMGRVQIDDGLWRARALAGGEVAAGAHLLVESVEGDLLLVRPLPR